MACLRCRNQPVLADGLGGVFAPLPGMMPRAVKEQPDPILGALPPLEGFGPPSVCRLCGSVYYPRTVA